MIPLRQPAFAKPASTLRSGSGAAAAAEDGPAGEGRGSGGQVRVFVGCAPDGQDAESQAVLEYTLRRHASRPVEITWMRLSRDPASPFYSSPETGEGWRTERWATPFSGFRWAVSSLCGFEGTAVYMDSDIIVCADIAELADQAFMSSETVLARRSPGTRFCVSLWRCSRAARWLRNIEALRADPGSHHAMTRLFATNPRLVGRFRGDWNCLDGEGYADLDDPGLKALHYTSMPHQPHLPRARARLAAQGRYHWFDGTVAPHWRRDLVEMFERLLSEADAAGFRTEDYEGGAFGKVAKKSLAGLGKSLPSWAGAAR